MQLRLGLLTLLGACTPSYDLEVRLGADEVDVGEPVSVVVRGTFDAPRHALAHVSVAVEPEGDAVEFPEVSFTADGATPSGRAEFLDGRHAATNESPGILFSLHDKPQDVVARWTLVCNTPGTWSVFAGVRLESASGAPLPSGAGNAEPALIVCE